MHQKCAGALAAVSLLMGSAAHSASDPGLSVPGAVFQRPNSGGVGAQIGVRIKLGDDRIVKEADRVELGVAAGPLLSRADARVLGGVRQNIAPLAKFTLKPGYSAHLSAFGMPVATRYSVLGAAQANDEKGTGEKSEEEKREGRRKTRKVIGYSALGALGAVVLTGVGLGILLATQGPTD
jgi:hypothetical protein